MNHNLYIKKQKRHKRLVTIIQIMCFISFICLWELATYYKWMDPFIFSSPSRVLASMYDLFINGQLIHHISLTLYETFLGFVIGTSTGILIALLLWWYTTLHEILDPYLVILNSLPKTALGPILIVWFGNNMTSIIIMSIMICIIITILSALTGFLEVDPNKQKLVYSFGGTKLTVLKKVILPATIPTLINILKVNIGLCLVGVIIGEFLVANAGLGYLIVYGSQVFKLDWVMLSVIILGLLAMVFYRLIQYIEFKLIHHGK